MYFFFKDLSKINQFINKLIKVKVHKIYKACQNPAQYDEQSFRAHLPLSKILILRFCFRKHVFHPLNSFVLIKIQECRMSHLLEIYQDFQTIQNHNNMSSCSNDKTQKPLKSILILIPACEAIKFNMASRRKEQGKTS